MSELVRDRPLRVVLTGFGLAGRVFHGPLIEHADGLELTAIVTSDTGRRTDANAQYPEAQIVSDLDDVWRIEPDLLVVAVPNRAHISVATQAIGRGVAVVVDKPLAVTAQQATRLVAQAAAADVPLTVFQNRRWDGDFLTVRRLIDEGTLGAVTRFESRFERFRPEVKTGWRELADRSEGGGQLLDLGAHLVDQARVLFGHPVRIYAEIETRRADALVDDDVFVAMEHPGGERSHLWLSSVSPLNGPRLRVSGMHAGFASDGLDAQEAQLADGIKPDSPQFGQAPPGKLVGQDGVTPLQLEHGNYREFYRLVGEWLRSGAPPPVDPRDAVAVLEIIEAARRSALERTVITVRKEPWS